MARGKIIIDNQTGEAYYPLTLSDLVIVGQDKTLSDWMAKIPGIGEEINDEKKLVTADIIKQYVDNTGRTYLFNGFVSGITVESNSYNGVIPPQNVLFATDLGYFVGKVETEGDDTVKYYDSFDNSKNYNNEYAPANRNFLNIGSGVLDDNKRYLDITRSSNGMIMLGESDTITIVVRDNYFKNVSKDFTVTFNGQELSLNENDEFVTEVDFDDLESEKNYYIINASNDDYNLSYTVLERKIILDYHLEVYKTAIDAGQNTDVDWEYNDGTTVDANSGVAISSTIAGDTVSAKRMVGTNISTYGELCYKIDNLGLMTISNGQEVVVPSSAKKISFIWYSDNNRSNILSERVVPVIVNLNSYMVYHDGLDTPTVPPAGSPFADYGWYEGMKPSTVWMIAKSSASINEGAWGSAVKMVGTDGKSVSIKGHKANATEIQAMPASGITDGDGWIADDTGDMWVAYKNGDTVTWTNVGKIQGDKGATAYVHIKYSPDGVVFSDNDGETPDAWMGIRSDYNVQDPPSFSAYTWKKIVGENSFISIVFKRTNSTPNKPSGGSYSSPVPSGWTDAVTDGDEIVWMSKCTFWSDNRATSWSNPQKMTDTADFDVCYHDALGDGEELKSPTSHHTSDQGNGWSDTASSNSVYMATDRCKNGVWEGWQINKIKGEKGASVTNAIEYYAYGTSTTPSTWGTIPLSPSSDSGKQYVWNRTDIVLTDSDGTTSTVTGVAHLVNKYIKDGNGVSSFDEYYAVSNGSQPANNSSAWKSSLNEAVSLLDQANRYLWNKEVTHYTDAEDSIHVMLLSVNGQDVSIDDGATKVEYAVSDSGTVTPSSWSTTKPSVPQGQYLWTKTTVTYKIGATETKAVVSYTVSYQGMDGDTYELRVFKSAANMNTGVDETWQFNDGSSMATNDGVDLATVEVGDLIQATRIKNLEEVNTGSLYYQLNGGALHAISNRQEVKIASDVQKITFWWYDESSTPKEITHKEVPVVANGVSSVTSFIYKRANSRPETPTGGDWTTILPSRGGWSDGIPEGSAKLWMSKRVFYSDNSQTEGWTTPSQMTDTSDFDVCFHQKTSNGNAPTPPSNSVHPTQGEVKTEWHDTALVDDVWMATAECHNGVWDSWQVVKIKGEDGAGVSSVTEQYGVSSSEGSEPSSWGTLSQATANWNTTNKYLWNKETTTYTQGKGNESKAHIVAIYTEDGQDGQNGRGITDITNYYKASNLASGETADDSTWKTNPSECELSLNVPYLWNYEKVTYTNGDVTRTTPCIISIYTTSVKAQYSSNATSWHNTFRSGDIWMRTSADGGSTWSDAVRIVGEKGKDGDDGDYTDYSFGISASKTTADVTTPPSDISSWSDVPIAITTAKPYLWMKEVRVENGTEGTAYYIRLTGNTGNSWRPFIDNDGHLKYDEYNCDGEKISGSTVDCGNVKGQDGQTAYVQTIIPSHSQLSFTRNELNRLIPSSYTLTATIKVTSGSTVTTKTIAESKRDGLNVEYSLNEGSSWAEFTDSGITVNASTTATSVILKATTGNITVSKVTVAIVKSGGKGDTGDTWKPNVSEDGELTWTKSTDGTEPAARNIKGENGKDGYTPQKGVDYNDGYTPRKNIDYFDGYTPVKGVDYFDGKTPVAGVDYYTDEEKTTFKNEVKEDTISELGSGDINLGGIKFKSGKIIIGSGDGNGVIIEKSGITVQSKSGLSTKKYSINSTGACGGSTAPVCPTVDTGDLVFGASGGGTGTTDQTGGAQIASDIRLKENIENIELTPYQIAQAPIFDFTYKSDDKKQSGTSAQYWKDILPNVVKEGSDGFLSMQYAQAAMVAVVSLAREVEKLRNEIDRLKNNQ